MNTCSNAAEKEYLKKKDCNTTNTKLECGITSPEKSDVGVMDVIIRSQGGVVKEISTQIYINMNNSKAGRNTK